MPEADSWSWQLNQQNSVSAKITMKHFYHHLLLLCRSTRDSLMWTLRKCLDVKCCHLVGKHKSTHKSCSAPCSEMITCPKRVPKSFWTGQQRLTWWPVNVWCGRVHEVRGSPMTVSACCSSNRSLPLWGVSPAAVLILLHNDAKQRPNGGLRLPHLGGANSL